MRKPKVTFWLFRTRKKGGGFHPRWRFRYLGPDGRMAYGSGFTDKTETSRLAGQMALKADEIRRGEAPPPQLADTESLRPIQEHIDAYLAWGRVQGGRGGRPWSPVHDRKQEQVLDWWKEALGLKTLRDITLPAVEKALQGKAKKASGKTLFDYAGTLRAFVNWCRLRKFLSGNPLEGLSKFDVTVRTRRRALSLKEVGELLSASPPERALIYRTALETGFRAGELQSLRIGDLDTKKGVLFLRADHAKDRRDYVQPLSEGLLADLSARCQGCPPEEPLFKVCDPHHAARRLYEDLTKAGIDKSNFHGKVDFHSLRVSSITLGIELGFDAKTARTLARHKTVDMTMNVYARVNPERVRGAVEKLGQAVGSALSKAQEEAQNSRAEVKREEVRLAAWAENHAYPTEYQEDTSELELVEVGGIAPPS